MKQKEKKATDNGVKINLKVFYLILLVFLLAAPTLIICIMVDPFKDKVNYLELESKLNNLPLPDKTEIIQKASGYDNLDLGATTYSWAALLVKSETQLIDVNFSILGNNIYGYIIPATEYFGLPYSNVLGEKLKLDETKDNKNLYIILIS